jgi:hypothetical protein
MALAAPPPSADSGASGSDTGDTGVDCGTPYEHNPDGSVSGGAGGTDHGSPENTPYDIDDFGDVAACAECHPNHYDEWHGSIHAYSASNPVMYQGSRSIGETTDFPLNCIGCHAPIGTLAGTIPFGTTVSDKAQLPEQAQHGVSCVSCHMLYDVVDGVNQYTHCRDYYFGTITDPQSTSYHENDYSQIHTEALVCRSCHNVENLKHLQVEYTYSEWLDANSAAGGGEYAPAIQTCQDCHMPAYTGTAAVDGPERTVHHHTFVGGDVALTPFPDSHRQYRDVQALMRTAGSLELEPAYTDGVLSGIDVAVTNDNEGHDLPSGSAFDRQVWVEIYVTDATGAVLLESGTLDADGDLKDWNSTLEPEADYYVTNRLSVFRSYLSDENEAETFDFIGQATAINDDSLSAGETRWIPYALGDTSSVALPLAVEVRLLYRPFPPFLLREHGLAEDLVDAVPVFEITRESLVLDTVTE